MFIRKFNGAPSPEGASYIDGFGLRLFLAVPAFTAFGEKYTITMVVDIGADNPLFAVVGPPPVGGMSYPPVQCLDGRHWRIGHGYGRQNAPRRRRRQRKLCNCAPGYLAMFRFRLYKTSGARLE